MSARPLVLSAACKRELSSDALVLDEIATPATPGAGTAELYVKSDHKLYIKDSTGTETALT